MLFLGMDLGSSGCKASVYDEAGTLLFSAARRYSFSYSADGKSELNPRELLSAAFEVLTELGQKQDLSALAALSVASFGEMFVSVGKNGEPLGNSISYSDLRGEQEAEEIEKTFGGRRLYEITGATAHGMYALPKLMWIKKHEPERFYETVRIQLFADYLLTELGAEPHTDYSLAARTLCFDIVKKEWSEDILKSVDIPVSLFAKPVAPGTPVGTIRSELAKQFNFPQDVILLAGAHDQVAAAMGVGALTPGIVLDGMGSNECLVPCFDRPLINDTMMQSHLVCVPHVLPGCYATYAFNATAGSAFAWYQDLMQEDFDGLLRDLPSEPTDMFFLPHMAGAATPYMDDRATGALVGLTLFADRKHITKAILEGMNYEMLVNLGCLHRAGFEVSALYAAGGMAQSDVIMQLKANMLGLPVYRCGVTESGAKGLILGGLVAKGVDKDLLSASKRISKTGQWFVPDNAMHERYGERFEQYQNLYPALRQISK